MNELRYLPYLLPWVRVLFLIESITSTEWHGTAERLVEPILRRALEMRRQIARDVKAIHVSSRPSRGI